MWKNNSLDTVWGRKPFPKRGKLATAGKLYSSLSSLLMLLARISATLFDLASFGAL